MTTEAKPIVIEAPDRLADVADEDVERVILDDPGYKRGCRICGTHYTGAGDACRCCETVAPICGWCDARHLPDDHDPDVKPGLEVRVSLLRLLEVRAAAIVAGCNLCDGTGTLATGKPPLLLPVAPHFLPENLRIGSLLACPACMGPDPREELGLLDAWAFIVEALGAKHREIEAARATYIAGWRLGLMGPDTERVDRGFSEQHRRYEAARDRLAPLIHTLAAGWYKQP